MISYSVMVSTAFALISVSMNTVYSVIIGPRNQVRLKNIDWIWSVAIKNASTCDSDAQSVTSFRAQCKASSSSSEVARGWLVPFLYRELLVSWEYVIHIIRKVDLTKSINIPWVENTVPRLLPSSSRSLFVHSGIGIPWIIEICIAAFGVMLWIVFYGRLVPLKMEESLSAGDRYRNKHGMVYKF